jgi:tRNA (guanine37-N1)-methyltransferase
MLMRPEPWGAALDELLGTPGASAGRPPRVVVPTPSGRPFTQAMAAELADEPWLLFACGRYEGIDQRVLDEIATRAELTEVSLGDYVLNGGEVAVLAIVEAVARLLPGVIGNAESLLHESYADGLLEGPAYTKPPTWRGRTVPDVLLSGNHAQIARWRRDEALRRTATRRPDLVAALDPAGLDRRDRDVLQQCGWAVVAAGGQPARLDRASPPVAD